MDQPCFALVECGGLVCLIEFGLIWFGYSTDKQTNKNYLILLDLISFEAFNFEFIVEKVWFGKFCIGLFWIDGLDQPCFALVEFGSLVCLIEFGLVWFCCSTDKETNNNYLILSIHCKNSTAVYQAQ